MGNMIKNQDVTPFARTFRKAAGRFGLCLDMQIENIYL